jgi:hypothetical protein
MIRADTEFERQLVLLALEVAANSYDGKAFEARSIPLAGHYSDVAKDIREVKVAPKAMTPEEFKKALEG